MMREWMRLVENASTMLDEIAPYDAMKSTRYYHGTSTTAAAKSIIEQGVIRPGFEVQGKGKLSPVAGRAYLTPELEYAAIYALGGVFMGSDMPERWRKDEPYGYIFVIDGADLVGDVQPDEDSVGAFFYKYARRIYDDSKRYSADGPYHYEFNAYDFGDTNSSDQRRVWNNIYRAMTPKQRKESTDGYIEAQASGGKRALKVLGDRDKELLIRWGAHVSHFGPVQPIECWKFDKSMTKMLRADASNILARSQKIWKRPKSGG